MISLQRNDRLRVVRRRALIVLAGALLSMAIAWFAPPTPARAQNQSPMGVSAECWNGSAYVPCSASFPLQVAGSFAASGFTPGLTFASLTATGSSAAVALPAGSVVAFQNTGTTTVSCTLGVGSATATTNEIQIAASSTVFVTVGTNTFGACIDQTGSASNLVVLAGGSGLGTGFGGGGGSSGGGGSATAGAGQILPITNDMTTTSATTTTGQSIGGLQTLANAVITSGALGANNSSGYIQNLTVTFTDAVGSGPLDVYYFNASPSGSTCTNDSAFVLANADRDKVIGIAHVTDFTSSNTAVVAQVNNLSMGYGLSSATSIFACVVARASFVIAGTANASLVTNVLRN